MVENKCVTQLRCVFPAPEEEQTTTRGIAEENDNSCDKDAATKQEEEEEGGISAPLVLSQERLEEVYRRLHCLQEQVKRLQVRRDEQSDYDSQMERRDNKR